MIINHKSTNKGTRINKHREQQLEAGFQWRGDRFDLGDRSLALIYGRALRLTLDNTIASVTWRSKDNQMVDFLREDFLVFALAVDAYVETINQQSWEAKDGRKTSEEKSPLT